MSCPLILAVDAAIPSAIYGKALKEPVALVPRLIPAPVPGFKSQRWETSASLTLSISGRARPQVTNELAATPVQVLIEGVRVALMTAVFGAAGFAMSAHAEQASLPDVNPTQVAPARPFLPGTEVEIDTLSRLRGGSDLGAVTNAQKLGGTVADNSASNIVTGANSITTGAFANVSGIPIVIQNSGANVLIQNATIINLQFQ